MRRCSICREALLPGRGDSDPGALSGSLKGAELEKALKGFYKDYNMPTDRRVAKRMFRIVKENCKELPSVFAEVIDKRFGGDTDAYVDYLYDNSVFADEQRALAAVAFRARSSSEDPAAVLSESIVGKMRELSKAQKEGRQKIRRRPPSLHRGSDAHAAQRRGLRMPISRSV